MSGSKHFDKIAWTATILILGITILFMNGGDLGLQAMAHTMGYETRLFDNTKVHTVDIVMDDWDEFIANATSEEYAAAAVVIDGEVYKNVGIRAKGNTSLSTVASLGSERYSFKIEFDHYDSSITYHGLDKLSLNNLIQDATMMKDYLTYTMMNRFGVDSSLCSYVYITVNGGDWGLYLAVEGVEDSFLERNYGSDHGKLYKPDSMSFGGGRGNGKDFDMGDFERREDTGAPQLLKDFDASDMPEDFDASDMPEGIDASDMPEDFDPSDKFAGGGNGRFSFGEFGMGSSDVKLQYIDDEPDSYSNIWNNAKTEITKADQERLIRSLKKLSDGEQIESVVDMEQVMRYFVVHNYVCNDDSYTGMMVHNYYLYEEDGQMAMIPWDYNLAFGTFHAADADSAVNTPIDNPVSGGASDRPMFSWIFESEEYVERYHQLFTEFLNTLDIQKIIDDAYDLIASYVEKDPTAFYTDEAFENGVETLRKFCDLRSESISMQIESGETTENMGCADASSISLSDMGTMDGMGREGNEKRQMPGAVPSRQEGSEGSGTGERDRSESSEHMFGKDGASAEAMNVMLPEGTFHPGKSDAGSFVSGSTGWIALTVSVLILGAGLVIAALYKR
ncbi:MAG: spore coat protein CotH [Lachnospiraceae bacterium]|nr:spore coat protein CotH [Lachnospiraceae bacterium]